MRIAQGILAVRVYDEVRRASDVGIEVRHAVLVEVVVERRRLVHVVFPVRALHDVEPPRAAALAVVHQQLAPVAVQRPRGGEDVAVAGGARERLAAELGFCSGAEAAARARERRQRAHARVRGDAGEQLRLQVEQLRAEGERADVGHRVAVRARGARKRCEWNRCISCI